MKKTRSRIGAVMAGCAMLAFSAPALADQALDDKLEERIEAQLKARKLGHVDVDVENAVATLKGEVATAAEKARAEKLAKVKGVTTVESKLEVDPDKAKARIEERADATKERIDQRAAAAKERVDGRTDVAKERVDRPGVTAPAAGTERRDPVVDPVVTAKVKSKFATDDLVKAHTINVDTDRDGVVTLRGTVPSEAARARAVEIAKMTDGVRKVNDQLTIAGGAYKK
jgi:hyperosmotically inducible protein